MLKAAVCAACRSRLGRSDSYSPRGAAVVVCGDVCMHKPKVDDRTCANVQNTAKPHPSDLPTDRVYRLSATGAITAVHEKRDRAHSL